MPDHARRLRHSIARFKRLLQETDDPVLAETYSAEIAAAEAMLEEVEQNSMRTGEQPDPPGRSPALTSSSTRA